MVYLIHFAKPFGHAKHYLGFVEDNLEQRIKKHRAGYGSTLLKHVNMAGINWEVVRIWLNADRNKERQLKSHSSTRYCPICQEQAQLALILPLYSVTYAFGHIG